MAAATGRSNSRSSAPRMVDLGRILIGVGVVLIIVGALLLAGSALKLPFLGRLPGDFYIRGQNWSFYFPLTTSILLSVVLTLLFSLFRHR